MFGAPVNCHRYFDAENSGKAHINGASRYAVIVVCCYRAKQSPASDLCVPTMTNKELNYVR